MPIPGPDPKILDDLARVAGGAVNIFSGLQEQLKNDMRARMDEMATKLDLVPREDLDRAIGMVNKLRTEVKELEARITALESGKASAKKPGKKAPVKATAKPVKKPAKKTTAAKAKPAKTQKKK